MSRTGGGIGTNQYATRGVSQARDRLVTQDASVVGHLAALEDSLDDWLDEGFPTDTDTPRSHSGQQGHEAFRVTDADQASWALRKYARTVALQQQARELAEKRKQQIDEWCATEIARHEGQRMYFESLLVDWHMHELAVDPRRKTIHLPEGELRARKTPAKVDVIDPDSAIEWAEHSGESDLIRVRKDVDKTAMREWLQSHPDETVPGVRLLQGEVSFTVSPSTNS